MLKLITGTITGFSIGIIGFTLGAPVYAIITVAFIAGWSWDTVWNHLFQSQKGN